MHFVFDDIRVRAIHLRAGHSRAGTGDAEDDAADPAHRRLAAAERRIGVLRTMVLMPRVAPPPLAPRGGAREEGGTTPTTDTARLWSTLRNIADLAFDSLAIAARAPHFVRPPRLEIRTAHPIALLSADHVHPRGTANDDTRHPRFVSACERRFPRPLSHLDLGCAGGGLVWDFLLAGHYSYGIEGSDFSRINRRGFWRVVPEQLFTADITEPFALLDAEGTPRDFHVITAWEVLEHLPEERLPGFLENIRRSLRGDGLFIASIATFPDEDAVTGAVWHVTIRPREWWLALFAAHGLRPCDAGFAIADHVRGSGNPRAQDWDARESPEMGFHVVLTHAEHVVPTHAEHVVLPHAEADRSGTDESGGAAP